MKVINEDKALKKAEAMASLKIIYQKNREGILNSMTVGSFPKELSLKNNRQKLKDEMG